MSPHPDVNQLLARANPVPGSTKVDQQLDERARADLATILTTPHSSTVTASDAMRVSGRPHTRRVVIAAAAAAAATVVLASGTIDWPGGGTGATDGAFAATPPPLDYQPVAGDAATVLTEIAARVATLVDDTGTGQYAMVATKGWYLSTRIDGRVVTSAVIPSEITIWRAPDGSGRTISRYTPPGEDQRVEDRKAAPGELSSMWPLRSLSPDDATLAQQLESGHPVENGPYERLVSIADAYRSMPLEPVVRANVLRYLAATPGLQLDGTVIDRLGRTGTAVSVVSDHSGLPTRYTMIIDPGTGQLLGDEQMLTTSAGKLNVPVPSVISYTAYRDSRYTADTE